LSNFSFVQRTPNVTPNAASQPFASNNTAGNFIIAIVWDPYGYLGAQGNTTDVTDSQGNTYTCIQEGPFATSGIYIATNIKAGANTVTVNVPSACAILAMEYSSEQSPYYCCPGSAIDTSVSGAVSNADPSWRGAGSSPAFTSAHECLVVWAAALSGAADSITAESGSVRYPATTIPAGVSLCVAAGDDDPPLVTAYSNQILWFGTTGAGYRVCVFVNLDSGGCGGGVTGYVTAPPGARGTGEPDSSYGPKGSSALPTPNGGATLVYSEADDCWMYHRNALGISRFYGFLFDGIQMLGLTGSTPVDGSADAQAWSVDDFRGFLTQDVTGPSTKTPIRCVFQSHFEDVAQPDNQKNWLEAVVDCIVGSGVTATVYVALDNAISAPLTELGTFVGTGSRQKASFPLGDDGMLATNISIAIAWSSSESSGACEIHNVYLYYYVEARLAIAASTLPTDLGSAQVKQCKELMLDIDASNGAVGTNIYSDLPGNALAVRQTPSVSTSSGRAIVKFPFSVTEGFLWRVALTAGSGPFRLYSARLLMRPVGVYVEAYESAAGFVYDTEPHTFESGLTHVPRSFAIALAAIPIKRFRELSIEIETFGGDVTVAFVTDLPGNTAATRCTWTVNTGTNGRRYVRLPLPQAIGAAAYDPATSYALNAFCSYAGNSWQSLQASNIGHTPSVGSAYWQPLPIEGRMCRLQFSGSSKFVLYEASVEFLPVGEYIEAYEASGGAVYDSREQDFGSKKPKDARELELDLESTGNLTVTLYCDLPGYTMAQCFQNTAVSTVGRQKILLPLTLDSAPFDYPVGRMYRLVINGASAFRLYGATLKLRELGCYLTGDEASASPAGVFDTTPLDMGTERMKEFKKLEIEAQTDAAATLNLWTDQPNGAMTLQFSCALNTGGARRSVKIPLTHAIRGRRIEVEVVGAGVRLFSGRVWWRPYNEPKAQWAWAELPIPPTPPQWVNAAFPVSTTPPAPANADPAQYIWGKILSIQETPAEWSWVDLDMAVSG
jgi:hypothetical protein